MIEACARQSSNEKPDISGTDELVDAYKLAVQALNGLRARKFMRSWKATDRLRQVQMFSSHAIHTPFRYICGSGFGRKEPADYFDSVLVYVASNVSSVEDGGVACSVVQSDRGKCKEVRNFAS